MSRKSLAEDMVDVFSRLPWWVCLILAGISYLIMDHYATKPGQPADTTGLQAGAMGTYVVNEMYHTLAWFGKFIAPFIFCLAGLFSIIRKNTER